MIKNKKILILTPFFSPNVGGSETFLDDLIYFINEKGVFSDVITYKPLTTKTKAKFKEERNKNNKIFRIPWPKFNLFYKLEKFAILQLIYLGAGIGFFCLFFLLFKNKKYQTINCHGLSAGFVCFILSFIFKNKYILTIHTNYHFSNKSLSGKLIKIISKRFKYILALSESCKNNFLNLGISPNKIILYSNWVDEKIFTIKDKREVRNKLSLKEDFFYALFVGRFSEEKGIFTLLKAIPKINKKIKLIIIGGGKKENFVKEISEKNKNISFLGRKSIEDLSDFFSACDVLVFAPVDEDYLGRVSISALHCGLPLMIPDYSFYSGKKTKVSLKINSKIGVKFKNSQKGFSDALNNIFKNALYFKFDKLSCKKYAMDGYGKEKNGNTILNTLIK